MYFKDVIGHEDLKEYLIGTAKKGLVPHAQLFTGKDGSGAYPLALAYARYLNCQNPTDKDACGSCRSCTLFNGRMHPDLIFVYPVVKASDSPTPSDDFLPRWLDMLNEQSYFTPNDWLEYLDAGNSQPIIYSREAEAVEHKLSYQIYEAKYRVLLLWQPERMHESMSNKLLKLIEEPPMGSIFLLVSAEPEKIIETIRSRTQAIELSPLSPELISQELLLKGLCKDPEEAKQVAHQAQGNWREAMDLAHENGAQDKYLANFGRMLAVIDEAQPKGMKLLADELAGLGREEQIGLLRYAIRSFRELYIYNLKQPELNYLSPNEVAMAESMRGCVTGQNIKQVFDELELAIMHIRRNVNGRMVLFDLLLQLTSHLSPALRKRGTAS